MIELCNLQGILSASDAKRAADVGIKGIIVSNHGGRQVDFAPAAIDMLPSIAQALHGRNIPILVDGGIRRGTDIIKARRQSIVALVLPFSLSCLPLIARLERIPAACDHFAPLSLSFQDCIQVKTFHRHQEGL